GFGNGDLLAILEGPVRWRGTAGSPDSQVQRPARPRLHGPHGSRVRPEPGTRTRAGPTHPGVRGRSAQVGGARQLSGRLGTGPWLLALVVELLRMVGGGGLCGQGLSGRLEVGELAARLAAHAVVGAGRGRIIALAGEVPADDVAGDVDRAGVVGDGHVVTEVVAVLAVDDARSGAQLDVLIAGERGCTVDLARAHRGALRAVGHGEIAGEGRVQDVGVARA